MIKAFLHNLATDRAGTSAVEMGLICAMIVLAMLTALKGVANETKNTWTTVSTKSEQAINGATAA